MEVLKSQIACSKRRSPAARRDQRISSELADSQAGSATCRMRQQELDQITRDYEVTKLNYHSLLEKQISAQMSTDMERRQKSERFTLIDPAHIPEGPPSPTGRSS